MEKPGWPLFPFCVFFGTLWAPQRIISYTGKTRIPTVEPRHQ
jgi:hypothetical protein